MELAGGRKAIFTVGKRLLRRRKIARTTAVVRAMAKHVFVMLPAIVAIYPPTDRGLDASSELFFTPVIDVAIYSFWQKIGGKILSFAMSLLFIPYP
ncbi:MAG: hypothetical protein QXO16_04195 [Archaeoglobaceae archaeon]